MTVLHELCPINCRRRRLLSSLQTSAPVSLKAVLILIFYCIGIWHCKYVTTIYKVKEKVTTTKYVKLNILDVLGFDSKLFPASDSLVYTFKIKETKEEQKRNHILYKSIEDNFQSFFGTKVKLDAGKRRGKIIIEYTSNDDLERILGLIK